MIYDPEPHIGYRRHGSNLVGDNISWRGRLKRINRLIKGQLSVWCDHNLASLEACYDLLSDEAQVVTDEFLAIRAERSGLRRLQRLRDSAIHRQSTNGNLGLYFATVLNRL